MSVPDASRVNQPKSPVIEPRHSGSPQCLRGNPPRRMRSMPADLVIRNARVIDGSGSPGFAADVEVTDGRITLVGTAGSGRREIDAAGQVLSPGFVDTHSHDDGAFLRHPDMAFKLAQGVTTDISGNCGFSTIPNEPG